jgi:dTDP-glucose pyrophosphorylase
MNVVLRQGCVTTADSLRAAMQAIDTSGWEIALVVDRQERLVGILTDGDIRRALLAGADLDDALGAHVNREFVAVDDSVDRAAALDLMQARQVSQLPVLDALGRVAGLHLLRELVGIRERPNAAVILAGGRGRRLGPLTNVVPKPLVPIAGRPLLERIVLHLVGSGIREVFVAVNYLAEQVEACLGDGRDLGCEIRYVRESADAPLGTAGALSLLPDSVVQGSDPLLVMNGDLVTQFSVGGLLATHDRARADLTIGVTEHRYEIPFGVVRAEGGLVAGVEEKPLQEWTVNAGIYAVAPQVLRLLPHGVNRSMPDLITACVDEGKRVVTHSLEGDWLDVGTPEQLGIARGEI